MLNLYHGSERIIKHPEYGKGKSYNDYGLGFYTTADKDLAGEWAVLWTGKDGYINEYSFDESGLNILKLDTMNVKRWIAILMNNRKGNYDDPLTYRTIENFKREYLLDINDYDVITGWRADDSYFSYVEAFVSGNLSLENLTKAMHFGNLGKQVCLISKEAFSPNRLKFVTAYKAELSRFYTLAENRDKEARQSYTQMVKSESAVTGTLIKDLL